MGRGQKHYTPDGKAYTGATHKMADGTIHTGAKHTSSSKKLGHNSGNGKQLSSKQMKIASAAPPKNAITGADFKKLQRKKKSGMAQSMGLA